MYDDIWSLEYISISRLKKKEYWKNMFVFESNN